ncbi:MAG: AAA family ATPase [Clostridia bacterium]|nr:AAA family ATPase [Clostridia bacterium]
MKFHILCGIPGSGKSTIARRLPGYVVSTDTIRKFLWQDESVVKHDKLVFHLAESISNYLLALGEDVIFDATNLTIVKRRRYINLARRYHATVTLHWVNCPLQTAIERNSRRERKVPVTVIKSLYNSFQKPKLEEGIDVIKVYGQGLNLTKVILPDRIVKR